MLAVVDRVFTRPSKSFRGAKLVVWMALSLNIHTTSTGCQQNTLWDTIGPYSFQVGAMHIGRLPAVCGPLGALQVHRSLCADHKNKTQGIIRLIAVCQWYFTVCWLIAKAACNDAIAEGRDGRQYC